MDTESKVCMTLHLACFFVILSFLSLCSARQIQNIADELDEVFMWPLGLIENKHGLNGVVTFR